MEVKAGIFLGHISALVREMLWKKCCGKIGKGGIVLIHSCPNEQGFAVKSAGKLSREVIDCEGLYLIRAPRRSRKRKTAHFEPETNDT